MKKVCTMLAAVILLCTGANSLAQTNKFENGTEGTEFWFSFPVCWAQSGGNNALKIYVSCPVAVQCTLEIPGYGISYVKTTKPNDVIDFTLFPAQGQPYEKADDPTSARTEDQTYADGKGKGIHVSAPVPITVYGVSRFTYTSDSFIALPTSSLGTEYIVASYADATGGYAAQHLMSQTVVVAAYDNTVVNFKLGGRAGTQTIGGLKIGQTRSWTLNKGDIIAFGNKKIEGIYGDLSGSKITSTKPVAVTSGNQCAYVDVTTPACDFLVEMELPTNTWGKEYHVTRFVKRTKYSFIKIFAKEPNTKLYRNGETTPFHILSTAGGAQGAGYYEGRIMVDESAPRPIIIRADKPISITQYNPGQLDDNVPSDPFQMVLTPIEQYQKEITFNTPGIKGGAGFKENYVNLVFEANDDGSMPNDLEFGTVGSDTVIWTPVKTTFGSSSELFKQFTGDTKKYYAKIIMLPADGVYKIRALKPFAAYAYGFDSYDSYGHPTSMITNDISVSDSVAPELVIKGNNPLSATFMTNEIPGSVKSNISRIFLNPEQSSNYRLLVDEFVPGQADSITFRAEVVNKSFNATATIVVVDKAGNYTTKTLQYIAVPDTSNPIATFAQKQCEACTEGIVTDFPDDVDVRSNIGVITLTEGTYNYKLEIDDFVWGNTSKVNWKLCVEDMTLDAVANLYFSDAAGNDTTVTIKYIAPKIKSTTSLVEFGFLKINESKEMKATVENTSPTVNQRVTKIRLASQMRGFIITRITDLSEPLSPLGSGSIHLQFDATAQGEYRDTLLIEVGDCPFLQIPLHAIVEAPNGIEDEANSSFTISPNPATGIATINLPAFKSETVFLKVFDALGNEVADFSGNLLKAENSQFRFDTSTLPNGAYFLRLTDGKMSFSRTFIIQN